ncbi:uncharacterized protein LOC129579264 isoform X1 [Sitodiplosis mosellana]|uniref:uncharacterized protein LOC129579264 isoform X1 n=2 Tax=Sitodiplosis mosellana TaxID=263140 RepID=UPI002444C6B6|nr:uncharacterized protein LOC129579264 isoform X1 [Sitodiplosis mosellana]XP_055325116.1 uncharacterized protein LOC129579264 isoform X1 [Sitodiplosis mosellana]XP_055325117.1 uncharacterized protein LOC129579264 isoform X1 [Sitodiplosis mosellana]XP_055325118.1 uncharacterized protein LOC129579264 isoform X1 [Sitodiplosis mosellana]XP_055325119.1 uncharacterized protein LOC129579264 isoform X1 [Sitodiplosis mosellana]
MHRVLSYQTAMQINDDRDIRTYITKRTCISLIFSASFFTLILGFLLGKFVSDRHYKIRQMTQPKYIAVIEQLQTLRRSIETSAQNISDSTLLQTHPKYNRLLWDEAIKTQSCTDKTIDQNFDINFEDFIEKLVDNELKTVVQCLIKLNSILNTLGKD